MKEFEVKYLGGEYRIPAVKAMERVLGGRDATLHVHAEGSLVLIVGNSFGTGTDHIEYAKQEVKSAICVANAWQMLGLNAGRQKYLIKVATGDSRGTVEVMLSFPNDWTLAKFEVAMEEAGLPRSPSAFDYHDR